MPPADIYKDCIRKLKYIRIDRANKNTEVAGIASFPRSGNTWVRFMLANVMSESLNERITFKNINDYVPDIDVPKSDEILLQDRPPNGLSLKLVKTHDRYMHFWNGKKVVYIVRDVIPAMESLWCYLNFYLKRNVSTDQLVYSRQGIYDWHGHVKSWLTKKNESLIVRYEDIKDNPRLSLGRICKYLELDVNNIDLDRAIKASSFDSMRQYQEEELLVSPSLSESRNNLFVRKGCKVASDNIFTEKQVQVLIDRCKDIRIKLGYV